MKPVPPLQAAIIRHLKPPSPLLAPQQRPLKPTTPLHPKNALNSPISQPQRRWRFQLTHPTGPQRRQGFQRRQRIGAQRRNRFHTTSVGPVISAQGVPATLHLGPHARRNSPSTTHPQPLFREKTRPARPQQRHLREETRPARHKRPFLGHFSLAGRTFSRSRPHQAAQGELFRAQDAATWRRCNHRHHCSSWCRPT